MGHGTHSYWAWAWAVTGDRQCCAELQPDHKKAHGPQENPFQDCQAWRRVRRPRGPVRSRSFCALSLLRCSYTAVEEFHEDVALMLDNCVKFNGKDSEYGKYATTIAGKWKKQAATMRARLAQVRGSWNSIRFPRGRHACSPCTAGGLFRRHRSRS